MSHLRIPVRRYRLCVDVGERCIESRLGFADQILSLDVDETVLVLVDVWNLHYIESWIARAMEVTKDKIVPVVEAARRVGMLVVHAPSPNAARKHAEWTRYAGDEELNPPTPQSPEWPPGDFIRRAGEYAEYSRNIWSEPYMESWRGVYEGLDISDLTRPEPGDFVISTGNQLHRLLKDRRILHLFYAGFATNMCLQFRDYGMRAMKRRGYNLILLRDCTTAVETHDTVAQLALTRAAVREIEMQLAYSTTSEDFTKACQAII